MKFWLWPNRVIGKRRSGELREEHNKAVQQIHDLRNALEAVMNSWRVVCSAQGWDPLDLQEHRSAETTLNAIKLKTQEKP